MKYTIPLFDSFDLFFPESYSFSVRRAEDPELTLSLKAAGTIGQEWQVIRHWIQRLHQTVEFVDRTVSYYLGNIKECSRFYEIRLIRHKTSSKGVRSASLIWLCKRR